MSPKSSGDAKKSDSGRDRLPFEPGNSRKPAAKQSQRPPASTSTPSTKTASTKSTATKTQGAIPEQVSRRMVRRMALLSGIPTFLGMSTFVLSYLLVSRDILPLPNYAVVAVSMGFFGLGVLGLSYGVLSASWEEEIPGSLVGWTEFTTNLDRMTSAWRASRK